MKQSNIIIALFAILGFVSISFTSYNQQNAYQSYYQQQINTFEIQQNELLTLIQKSNLTLDSDVETIKNKINQTRLSLKGADIWLRYLEPLAYKKINGPLPVEWETEVFEKFEKPYKREGAGLTLAYLYLDEDTIVKETLLELVKSAISATQTFKADSITSHLNNYHHYFLCNRLYLLNLAAIYTTGFECPDTVRVIPELQAMMKATGGVYKVFNESFPQTPFTENYLALYNKAIIYAISQPGEYSHFDHFTFVKDYVNPLFAMNQQMILQYKVVSKSMLDYSLNKNATSIFSKDIYSGQNPKGIFLRVNDPIALTEIAQLGKMLFYDPLLSGNNQRSCASCHQPTQFFTDTLSSSALHFDSKQSLARNTPSLLNAEYNHLLMLDGKHFTFQHQAKDVITNSDEMGSNDTEVLKKILTCKTYKNSFTGLLKYTPQEKQITLEHITSAITLYYNKFSKYEAPFDDAINKGFVLDNDAKEGFNLFMSKAQCATCHFAPQFNGVKPPYIGSEFEVLGVPLDKEYKSLSNDKGRHGVNPATETLNAFRTGSVRNASRTMPYMHNGVFKSLREVVDFYDGGGGAGRGLKVDNQTLSSDSLHLSENEKQKLLKFMDALTEKIVFENPPQYLPVSKNKAYNSRKVGGVY